MNLSIKDEFAPLKAVVVTEGVNIPNYDEYKTDDPEFTKFHPYSWDKNLFVKQQRCFLDRLSSYDVELIIPDQPEDVVWQTYTRDTGFVINNKLYFSKTRKLKARNGEIDILLNTLDLQKEQLVEIKGDIEGGDVLVKGSNEVFLGRTSRTNDKSIKELSNYVDVKTFNLGSNVMHLDTRMTLLPNNVVLITPEAFKKADVALLEKEYKLIYVNTEEAKKLGTNVFIVNPETIFVPTQHRRISDELKKEGFKIELIDYTEPINLGGSFRCTTLPLIREY